MPYQIDTQQFKGPLEKLLELIEEKKMEITDLNLALVTEDFLKYLESIKKNRTGKTPTSEGVGTPTESVGAEEELRLLADFVVVASKLLLIKSKALLPSLKLTSEEEKDIKDLQQRLIFYRQFKPAILNIKKLFAQKRFSASRPLFWNRPVIFSPPKNLSLIVLQKTMDSIFETVKQLSLEIQTIENTLIKIEEKIEEIISKIQEGVKKFGHLIKEKPKKEIIAMFLALLHLLRDQLVEVEQEKGFSEITIKKVE